MKEMGCPPPEFWVNKKTGGELCLLVGLPALLHLHPPLPPSSHQPGDPLSGTAQKQVLRVKSMNWGMYKYFQGRNSEDPEEATASRQAQ